MKESEADVSTFSGLLGRPGYVPFDHCMNFSALPQSIHGGTVDAGSPLLDRRAVDKIRVVRRTVRPIAQGTDAI